MPTQDTRVALFIPSTFFFFNFKLLTPIVMLKMINIYPLFIALSMFQMKHFRNYFDKCCWNPQHGCSYCILQWHLHSSFTLIRSCFCTVLLGWVWLLSHYAGVSFLRVWMAGRVNQSMTVPVNEVKITFLILCCPHLHSRIFLFIFMF